MATLEPLVLDGRTLEGGGQLLRIALGLSALTGIPVRIHSIRGNRSGGGGLKAQHLACVNWLAHACEAHVEGADKGSKELLFVPKQGREGLSPVFRKTKVRDPSGDGMREVFDARLDIKTAGSTGLALQAILPFILFTRFPSPLPVRLTLSGGTNVSQSPSYEYITQVLLPTLETIGFPRIEAKLGKRGWSQGGSSIGNFTLEIPPRSALALPAFNLTPPFNSTIAGRKLRSEIQHLHATFIAPETSHTHFLTSLKASLKSHLPQPKYPSFTHTHGNLSLTLEDSRHTKRMYLLLVATITYPEPDPTSVSKSTGKVFRLGRDLLYGRKLPQKAMGSSHNAATETMTEEVCAALATEIGSGACVDEHLRDQLVVFQALARGRGAVFGGEGREASLHARTAEWVAAQVLGGRDADGDGVEFDGEGGARGMGFSAVADADDGNDSTEGGGKENVEAGVEEEMRALALG